MKISPTLIATALLLLGTSSAHAAFILRMPVPGIIGQTAPPPVVVVPEGTAVSLALAAQTLPAVNRTTPYTYDFKSLLTIGGDTPPAMSAITWSSEQLPPGLALSTDGILSGTPTVAGITSINVTASYDGVLDQKSYPLTINPKPLGLSLAASNPPGATRAVPYTFDFGSLLSITGDNPPSTGVTWSTTTGTVPDGLTLSTTGILSGTPNIVGTTALGVKATYQDKNSPAQTFTIVVAGQSIDAMAITTGRDHACALTAAGIAYCWGKNTDGQLGNGNTSNSNTPVAVTMPPGVGFTQIAAGVNHTCALTATGSAYCWGQGYHGQLGHGGSGAAAARLTPAIVPGGLTFVQIATGNNYSCGVTSGGAAKCWGINGSGQIGDNSTATKYSPAAVTSLGSGVTSIATGESHACATLAGSTMCWGAGSFGRLGNGQTTQQTTPVAVSGLTNAVSVGAGYGHTCALISDGTVQCWGRNLSGELGVAGGANSATPVSVPNLSAVTMLSTHAGLHNCAVTAGTLKCWGRNNYGALGKGDQTSIVTPTTVASIGTGSIAALATGDESTCVALLNGEAQCWGSNVYGGVGNGTGTAAVTSPSKVLLP